MKFACSSAGGERMKKNFILVFFILWLIGGSVEFQAQGTIDYCIDFLDRCQFAVYTSDQGFIATAMALSLCDQLYHQCVADFFSFFKFLLSLIPFVY